MRADSKPPPEKGNAGRVPKLLLVVVGIIVMVLGTILSYTRLVHGRVHAAAAGGAHPPTARTAAPGGAAEARPPADPAVPLAAQCRAIGLGDGEFEVTLCNDPKSCRGSVMIRHAANCTEDGRLSDDPDTEAFLKRECGPDAYEVRLQGPELVVARAEYRGGCASVAPFELALAGVYGLTVRHLYQNYDAVTEYHDRRHPKWSAHYHRDRRIARDVGDVDCNVPTREKATRTRQVADRGRQLLLPDPATKPRCTGAAAPGRWVAAPRGGWDWEPYACAYPALRWSVPEAAACLANRVVTFLGDSQQRSMYYAFLNRVSPTKIQNNPKAMGGRVDKVGSVTLVYHTDPWLDKPQCWYETLNGTRPPDAVLAGFGNWPAAGSIGAQGKWSDKKYRAHVELKARELRAFKARAPRTLVYWLGMPAFPHPPIDSRRNNQRLLHMVRSAAAAMGAAGVPVVDAFQIAEGMTGTSQDGSHYVNHVTATIAAVALSELCREWGHAPPTEA